jgi:hypothetical protein
MPSYLAFINWIILDESTRCTSINTEAMKSLRRRWTWGEKEKMAFEVLPWLTFKEPLSLMIPNSLFYWRLESAPLLHYEGARFNELMFQPLRCCRILTREGETPWGCVAKTAWLANMVYNFTPFFPDMGTFISRYNYTVGKKSRGQRLCNIPSI